MRPIHTWTRFDFGLAVVALPFLAFGLVGVGTIAGALSDASALEHDCQQRECYHHGTLVDHVPGVDGPGRTYTMGAGANYCILTMNLDVGTEQTAIAQSFCSGLVNGSAIDAEIWRSQVMAVRIAGRQIGTYLNPEVGIPVGVFRALALFPALLIVAMIRCDVMNRHVVPRIARKPYRPRTGLRDGAS